MAATFDLRIEQGADYGLELRWQNADGTYADYELYEYRAQVREEYATTAAMDFVCEYTNNADGEPCVSVRANAAATGSLDFTFGVWDLEAEHLDTGFVVRLVQGRVEVLREVTK